MARLGRLLAAVGITLLVGLVAAVAMAVVLLTRLDHGVDRLPDVFAGLGNDRPTDTRAPTFLVVLTDSNPSPTGDQLDDTVLLAHLGEDGPKAAVVALPPDTFRAASATAGVKGADSCRLARLVQMVEDLTAVHVDHLVVVDLAALPTLVDVTGGVDLPLADAMYHSDTRARRGFARVDGSKALAWVHNGTIGPARLDLDPTNRRVVVLRALLLAQQQETLLNPVALDRLLSAVAAAVRVDETLGPGALWRLAPRLAELRSGSVRFVAAPLRLVDAGTAPINSDDRWSALRAALRSESLDAYLLEYPQARFRWWA